MDVRFDNAGLHETFEDVDVSEFFDDDPDYIDKITYKGWSFRRT